MNIKKYLLYAGALLLAATLPVSAQFSALPPTGFSFNVSQRPTVQNAAYAAGQSLGGLMTFTVQNTAGQAMGLLQQIAVESVGGSVVASDVYVWDANPTNSTCTDKTNFVVSVADNIHLVIQKSITPALIAGAQDTHTYGYASSLNAPFNVVGAKTLWVCVLAHAAVTPATTADLRFNLQGQVYIP